MKKINHTKKYFSQVSRISKLINKVEIDSLIKELHKIRKQKGRVFFLGIGGSAGNSSHAVNDFRKLCNIECYAPTDNISEFTAITNDEGWKFTFVNWLKTSKLNSKDALFVLSVGGGNKKKKINTNLIYDIDYAKRVISRILSIIGKKYWAPS